jgi:hypothetical protein
MKIRHIIYLAIILAVIVTVPVSATSTDNSDLFRITEMQTGSSNEDGFKTGNSLSVDVNDNEYYPGESIDFIVTTNLPAETPLSFEITGEDGALHDISKLYTTEPYVENSGDNFYTIKGYVDSELAYPDTYRLVVNDENSGASAFDPFRVVGFDTCAGYSNEEEVKTGNSLSVDVNDNEYNPGESIDFIVTTNLPAETSFSVEITGEDGVLHDLSKLYMTEPYVQNSGENFYTIKGYADSELAYPDTYRLVVRDENSGVSAFDPFRVVGFDTGAGNSLGNHSPSEYVIRVKTDMTGSQTGLHLPGQTLTVSALTTFEPGTILLITVCTTQTRDALFEGETTVIEGDNSEWNKIEEITFETEGWQEGSYLLQASEEGVGVSDSFAFSLNTVSYNSYENQNQNENQNEGEDEDEGMFNNFFRFFFGFFMPE